MGVHDKEQYPEVKRLLGIPQHEPIFILRGQDNAAPEAISAYSTIAHRHGATREFLKGVSDVSLQFADWRDNNRELVKTPD